MTIGEKIKRLRIYTKLTQKRLGELSGTSEITIRQYEAGKRQPRIEQLKKIAKVFDFPLYLLLDDDYELGDVELEMKRAKPYKSYEMVEPPRPFTAPLSQYNNGNSIYKNLREISLQKESNRKSSTDEEEQIFIDIPEKPHKNLNMQDADYDPLSYDNSYSFASSEEEFDQLQEKRQIQLKEKNDRNIHKYDATIEVTPEAMERLKEDAEARGILKKYESGEKISETEYKKVIEYHNRMMERTKLLNDWLEWYKSTCEPLNNEGRKKVAEYAETLSETDKYTKPKEWFKGRMTEEEIANAVEEYLKDDTPPTPQS